MQSPQYVAGVSCPHCYDKVSAEKRATLTERQKQVMLAKQRGETHIGENRKNRSLANTYFDSCAPKQLTAHV